MIYTFLLKYWLQLVLVVALVGGISTSAYTGYRYIHNKGYQEASAMYTKRIQEYEASILSRIDIIETNSTLIIEQQENLKLASAKEFKAILKAAQNRPMYTIQAGVCAPSEDFIKTFNDAIARANQK